jgi:hypothetical protein
MLCTNDLLGSPVVALFVENVYVRRHGRAASVTHAALDDDTDAQAFAWGCC